VPPLRVIGYKSGRTLWRPGHRGLAHTCVLAQVTASARDLLTHAHTHTQRHRSRQIAERSNDTSARWSRAIREGSRQWNRKSGASFFCCTLGIELDAGAGREGERERAEADNSSLRPVKLPSLVRREVIRSRPRVEGVEGGRNVYRAVEIASAELPCGLAEQKCK
jgi:hypothetical protein